MRDNRIGARLARPALLGAWLAALPLAAATAEEDSYPKLSGAVGIEVQNDYNFDSEDPANEQNELGTTIEPVFVLSFSESVFVEAGVTLEAVEDPDPSEDRVFQDHGAYVDTLTLNYEGDGYGVNAGKFGPHFSVGYDLAAGLYGTDIAGDDIELAEFWGAGGVLGLGNHGYGDMSLSASVFLADRTVLSESFITNRGRNDLAAGGPGNTEAPENFAIAFDGADAPLADGFNYHVSFARLGFDAADTEYRAAVAGEWYFELENGVGIVPFVEYVHFFNADGNTNEDRHYVITSLAAEWEQWHAALAYTGKVVTVSGGGNGDTYDDQIQLSGGYVFENGIGIDVGYKFNRTAGIETQTVGALLSYGFEF